MFPSTADIASALGLPQLKPKMGLRTVSLRHWAGGRAQLINYMSVHPEPRWHPTPPNLQNEYCMLLAFVH